MMRLLLHSVKGIVLLLIFLASAPALAGSPYQGSPFYLSSTIGDSTVVQAEFYDKGDEGETYHDTSADNEGGEFRTEGVDISSCGEGCKCLSSINAGEWVTYSINNSLEGDFDMELRTASAYGEASMSIEIASYINVVTVPFSGSFDSWRTATIFSLGLPKGPLTLKLFTSKGNYLIDYVKFIRRTDALN